MAANQVKLFDPDFLDDNPIPKSFLDALLGAASSVAFMELFVVCLRYGSLRRKFQRLLLPLLFSLARKFPKCRPPLDVIRKFFFNLKLSGEFSVTLLDAKHVLIKLINDLDYCRVFAHRSYFVNNCFMKLAK
ncbi:hypothetical protein M5K25_015153 [Dendrobium thyrsiflorum]|uniref:Uncharacterized protein n=1 Tax=Dendrobium thyrsiflorum TaxID=117978 RepID=A0ABD0UQ56_DENTH